MIVQPLASWPIPVEGGPRAERRGTPEWAGPRADPALIVQLVRAGGTGIAVGAVMGISRERVRQVWKRETGTALPTWQRSQARRMEARHKLRPCACGGQRSKAGYRAHVQTVAHVDGLFWKKVDLNGPLPELRPELGPCWVWTGALSATAKSDGYPHFQGSAHQYGHRYSYERHHGPIPVGLTIDHLCRMTRCVRPSHLEAVTHKENVRRGKNGVLRYLRQPGASGMPQSHCLRGHALTEENRTPSRACRQCNAIRSAKSHAKRRAAA